MNKDVIKEIEEMCDIGKKYNIGTHTAVLFLLEQVKDLLLRMEELEKR